MSHPAEKDDVGTSLSKLSIKPAQSTTKSATKKTKKVVADSWEDEEVSDSGSGSETEPENSKAAKSSDSISHPVPSPPPPTPSSPEGAIWPSTLGPTSPRNSAEPGKRPEKTDAVARRMIAAGLGLKAPKLTDEQRAFQKSVREQEKKKKDQERAEEQKRREDAERAKAAAWDD